MSVGEAEIRTLLSMHTGTDVYYTPTLPTIRYTDGVRHMADLCEAYWLVQAIAAHNASRVVRRALFQLWTLHVKPDRSCMLRMREDVDRRPVVSQRIPYTTFPLAEIKLYCSLGVLMLPSEY